MSSYAGRLDNEAPVHTSLTYSESIDFFGALEVAVDAVLAGFGLTG